VNALDALTDLARALGRRRALALVLGAVIAFAAAAGGAAVLAWFGILVHLRWLPLALWVSAVFALAAVTRAARGALAAHDVDALRRTAALVEDEQAMRRGMFVGLVDLAAGAPEGTSPQLALGAARRVAAGLPGTGGWTWVPRRAAALELRLRRRTAIAALAVGLAGAAIVAAGPAAASLVSPLRALRAAVRSRVQIAVSRNVAHAGDSVTVTVTAEPGTGALTLYVRRTGERWRPLRLRADERGQGREVLVDLRAATFVYATAGGRASDTLEVRVLQPLVLGELAVRAKYPAYLQRADEDVDPTAGPLALPVGTVLALHGTTNAPLASARLAAGADTVPLRATGTGFDGELVVRGTAVWILAVRERGAAALAEPRAALDVRAVPDSAPVVTIPVPSTDTTMPLDLRALVVVDARDDHGLARAELVSWRVSRLGVAGDSAVDSIPGIAGADRIVQSQVLDATARGLLPGDTLRFFVRAWDRAPIPHMGRSRVVVLRLRSMAELREAMRAGTDTLSRAASGLAADQQALTRQTEDLAAQRDRAQDRPPRAGEQRPGSDRSSPNTGTEQFEPNAQAQRALEEQQTLLERADSLRGELERLMRAADQAGLNDPAWQQRLRELDELLRQAMTPELQRQLDALRRALEQLDPRAVQDALRRLVDRQQELRDQLQRSAELFERAAIEGSMQTFASTAEQLRREQQEWADRARERQDSAAAAAEEQQLRRNVDSLRRQLDSLEQRLARRGDSAGQQALARSGQHLENGGQSMQQASRSMQQGQRPQASRQGNEAAQQLQQTSQEIEEAQQQMSSGWRAEVQSALEQSAHEAVQLATEEQRLARELRRGEGARDARSRQSAMEQGVNQVTRRLQDAAGKNALVSPRLGAMMSQARTQVSQSREALEGPSPSVEEAAERAGDAAQALSAAAMQMLRVARDVAGAQSGSGYQEAMQRLAQMAGQQGQLNDELGDLLPMIGAGRDAVMQQLRQLAQRQRGLANQLERLGESGVPGNPQQLADEARALADRIQQARLDRGTLERQQQLFRRMLDAGRMLRGDDQPQDPERRSRTAQDLPARPQPATTARAAGLRYPVPSWSDLRELAPAERAMVLDYFRRLNATSGGPNEQR
jgi:hypothetical protein